MTPTITTNQEAELFMNQLVVGLSEQFKAGSTRPDTSAEPVRSWIVETYIPSMRAHQKIEVSDEQLLLRAMKCVAAIWDYYGSLEVADLRRVNSWLKAHAIKPYAAYLSHFIQQIAASVH